MYGIHEITIEVLCLSLECRLGDLRAVEWVHSVVISRGEVIVNETSPTSARSIFPMLHASLHVYCMDHNSIERMRWVPMLDMIDVLFTFTLYKTYKLKKIWLCNTKLTSQEIEPFFLLLIPEDSQTDKHILVHLWPTSGCVWTNLHFIQWKHEKMEESSKKIYRLCVNRYRTIHVG